MGGAPVPGKQEATAEEFKAMAHPLRLRILRYCLHEPHTNKEIADHFDKDPATTLHHVRLLVRTGFLVAEPVRAGRRGALEKPYRATGKTWDLSLSRPEDQGVEMLAVLDALRDELLEVGPDGVLAGARMGLKLSDERAAQLEARIEDLVAEYADRLTDDEDGRRYGLYVNFHRLA
jgi:DNA-binding transcriptional ArsR family regulator